MNPLRGVILDLDGTLVDSNDAHAQAWVDAFTEAGYDVPFDRVRRLIGMGGDKLMPTAIGVEKESEEGQRLDERRGEVFKARYLPEIRPFPDVAALLQRMKQDGHRIVVASSSKEDDLERLLEIAGVTDLVDEYTSVDDIDESKPAPDAVHAALDKLGTTPAQTIMLGDTPYDIEAAHHAEVPIIALRSGGWDDADLEGAVAVYDDPADLLAQYDTSPLALTPARE